MKKELINILLIVSLSSCVNAQSTDMPSDADATRETINLYRNLKKSATKGFLFGHQDDLAYGVHWKYQKDSSDVKGVTGDYPALYGWDLGGTESNSDKDIDGVPFKSERQFIKDAYERGGVITLSWHFNNPMTGGNAWDTTHGTVASILPGGANNELFKGWLDNAAKFLLSLKGKNGELIPVLFRPFHELSGTWFWWCKNNCTPDEFKILWRYEIYYLKHEKNVHNLIYVYNTSDNFDTADEFLERYPGDDVADVLSYDSYQYDDPATSDAFIKHNNKCLDILEAVGKEKNKIIALAETGYEQIPYAEWWTKTLIPAIGNHKIAYVLVWRNWGWNEWMKPPHMHYYVPFQGDKSADDFIKFYNLDNTLFEKDAANEKLYE
jgi:mannan endo-1,4-beta-mannosidase